MSKLKMKRKRYVCHRCNATHEYPRTYLTYKDGHRIGYVANFGSVCEEWEGSDG